MKLFPMSEALRARQQALSMMPPSSMSTEEARKQTEIHKEESRLTLLQMTQGAKGEKS